MTENDICKIDSVDYEKIEQVRKTFPDQTVIVNLADNHIEILVSKAQEHIFE